MQSRKNFKKYHNRSNLYLIIIAGVLILAVVFGVVLYNHHIATQKQAREFATNHFNPNVSIYGVDVGNLTVAKATKKINQRANNIVVLEKVRSQLSATLVLILLTTRPWPTILTNNTPPCPTNRTTLTTIRN